jgi:hypothetical protein
MVTLSLKVEYGVVGMGGIDYMSHCSEIEVGVR